MSLLGMGFNSLIIITIPGREKKQAGPGKMQASHESPSEFPSIFFFNASSVAGMQ